MDLKKIIRKILRNKQDKIRKPIKTLIAIIIVIIIDEILGFQVSREVVLDIIDKLFGN